MKKRFPIIACFLFVLASSSLFGDAIVSKIEIQEPTLWNSRMILGELQLQLQRVLRALPSIIFNSAILLISWGLAKLTYKLIPRLFYKNIHHSLLQEVVARGISVSVFLLGLYFIFEISEMTTMALAILSGTGIIGLIFGIAFRDIAENFLASILLSLQNPFRPKDLIDVICPVTGYCATGIVDRLTLRATILVSLEGNQIQIPNATVYKSNIRNYTTNPNHREDFFIGISPDTSISNAEEVALRAILNHEAVLKDPEPLVLVDSLSKDQVHLRIYYWIDARKHNMLKVKSDMIRLVKQALDPVPPEAVRAISKITTGLPRVDKG